MAAKKAKEGHAAHTQKADQLGILDSVQRPLKVVFLGAGSGFLEHLAKDVLSIAGADKGEFALVDIDQERLQLAEALTKVILAKTGKTGWKLTATTQRADVLEGADYIINCIEVSGTECVRFDNDIPMKFGVTQCIGDTGGPGGLFKALRTVPVWLDVLADVERLCPDAWVLNYTNPMSIMCLAAARASKAKVVGLCHSVQGTSHVLARYADVPYHEMKWQCAGINHLAWFTELSRNGEDLYPILCEKVTKDPELLKKDPVRFDVMLHLGSFVTESSGHFSEYLPYYRKRPELIDKYCGEGYLGATSFYADGWPGWRKRCDQRRRDIIAGKEEPNVERSWEYASFIIEAIETGQPFVIHGNVPNAGLITNLPADGVVEVACLVDRRGVRPTHFGRLAPQLAAISDWNMRMYDLAADACIQRSPKLAAHALMVDPLSASCCCPAEIRQMTEELFEAEREFLPGF